MRVSRDANDVLVVEDGHGSVVVLEKAGPSGRLHPKTAAEAKGRPWFFTGSPFGAHIVGLAWERHAEQARAA